MKFTTETYDLQDRSDEEIAAFLGRHGIGLTLEEARQLQKTILGRPPSLAEFILFGIEGSEHCSYKSSRDHLKQFVTDGENVVLGAREDAGVVRVVRDRSGTGYCVVISHESHNHPSQIVPYEGAATGVGGNVRDICCMGAEVIALADDLRFGPVESPRTRWIYEGVVSGVAGYGNPIGVPSLAGGLQFDQGYQDNCLVTVVSLGILREDRIFHSHAPLKQPTGGPSSKGPGSTDQPDMEVPGAHDHDLILVGKPTDASGFGGASFASFELAEERLEENKGAVQEPNAFLGRHLLQASTALFAKLAEMDACHRVGCKDLGAGGIACAAVEIAESGGYGAELEITRVHTDGTGYPPHVILCSETQERYLWAVPKDLTPIVLEHFNSEYALPLVSRGAQARVIGRITDSPQFRVAFEEELIVDAPASEVTRGFLYHRPWREPVEDPGERSDLLEACRAARDAAAELKGSSGSAPAAILLELLAHENIASRKPLYDRYDKQVQGRVVVEAGGGDGGILAPFDDRDYPEEIRNTGLTLTTDQNPRINRRDPHLGAILAVVEAFTNTVATGADPIAVSDCLCYGNPENPDQMGQFVAGCRGIAEACRELNLPIVAGNVSFYNESASGSIPPSPMIACVGRLTDYRKHLPNHLVAYPGDPHREFRMYLLGARTGRWGGSVYEELLRRGGADHRHPPGSGKPVHAVPPGPLPRVDFGELRAARDTLLEAAGRELVLACHDISEGGLAVTLCEMSFPESIGCAVTVPLPQGVPPEVAVFEETPGFVVAVGPHENDDQEFLELCRKHGAKPYCLGVTTGEPNLRVEGVLDLPLEQARRRWEEGLMEKLL